MPAASRTRLPQRLALAIACAGVLAAGVPVPAQASERANGAGVVYTETNDPAGNHIVVHARAVSHDYLFAPRFPPASRFCRSAG